MNRKTYAETYSFKVGSGCVYHDDIHDVTMDWKLTLEEVGEGVVWTAYRRGKLSRKKRVFVIKDADLHSETVDSIDVVILGGFFGVEERGETSPPVRRYFGAVGKKRELFLGDPVPYPWGAYGLEMPALLGMLNVSPERLEEVRADAIAARYGPASPGGRGRDRALRKVSETLDAILGLDDAPEKIRSDEKR